MLPNDFFGVEVWPLGIWAKLSVCRAACFVMFITMSLNYPLVHDMYKIVCSKTFS